ncbi:MAG: hypothetical protein PHX93_01210 [Candidatus Peribacteraceae bacterium]|jgi:hypothetical protein|nr:hypothetical protein [Candidatus Peribacteraceae bacterium]
MEHIPASTGAENGAETQPDPASLIAQVEQAPEAQNLLMLLEEHHAIGKTFVTTAYVMNGPRPLELKDDALRRAADILAKLGLVRVKETRRREYLGGVPGTTLRRSTYYYNGDPAASLTPLGFTVLDALRAKNGQPSLEQFVRECRESARASAQQALLHFPGACEEGADKE